MPIVHFQSYPHVWKARVAFWGGQKQRGIDMVPLLSPQPTKTPFYCENRRAIYIAHNDVFHERTKHIKIDSHMTHQDLMKGNLWLNLFY